MDDKIVELEEYKNKIKNIHDLNNGLITLDDLSLEEIEDLKDLYQKEIIGIENDLQKLMRENKKLSRILEK